MIWALRWWVEIVRLRADDRSATSAGRRRRGNRGRSGYSPAHGPTKRVFVFPRLAFFLMRRRTAAFKDAARQLLIEIPLTRWRQFRVFLREEEVTVTELIYAIGYLMKATFYPAAALITSIAALIGALAGIGVL
jgi:hypothetical protein